MDSHPFWGPCHAGLRSRIPACSSAAIKAMPFLLCDALLSSPRKGACLCCVSDLSWRMFPWLALKYQRINIGFYVPPLLCHQMGGLFFLPTQVDTLIFSSYRQYLPGSGVPSNSLLFHSHRVEHRRRRMISASWLRSEWWRIDCASQFVSEINSLTGDHTFPPARPHSIFTLAFFFYRSPFSPSLLLYQWDDGRQYFI